MENALLNLCNNAADAMPNGGRLTLETANVDVDQQMAGDRNLAQGQYVIFSVSDTGIGMTATTISRAFDPFFTTKPLGAGTGLGLSMVYGFAKQSGGNVRIYSEIGRGTTVRLYIPRFVAPGEMPESPVAPLTASRSAQSATILIVDDEETVRTLAVEVLEEMGCTILEAHDGPSGLEVLRTTTRIDLLVTDVGLPGMNGRQLADAARSLRPDLKVLFITGYAENAVINHGHLDPGMEILTKPFSLDALSSRVRSMLAR